MRILAVLWLFFLVRLCGAGRRCKVDTSLFNVEEEKEDGVRILKLTAKAGVTAKKVKYDGERVWKDDERSCLSAILYLDGEKPTLAVLVTRNAKYKLKRVYRYHNGKKWKRSRKSKHKRKLKKLKKKLTALKGKCKPADKPVEPQTFLAVAPPPFKTTPITLDLASPDQSTFEIGKSLIYGVSYRGFIPKDAFYIFSVMDAGVEVWTAGTGETSGLVNSYTKGDSSLITIGVDKGDDLEHKHFEKLDGKWREVTLGDFLNKLKEMNKSGSSPNPFTTSPFSQ
ncbi:signal peptide-containing protein [Theileria equi strain WA]|uniref:Signal peptide-containing protein n=1 Tax=Theileria equi strain WA TaxID=1537102 RepID=L0AWT2_THEEQ|nr:signal peptide-containing protein [Theileria equi strain WA]AFZ79713.1 signal peptide-containing protein [Theileria equi strain WA]|eukprot:XP_004829379.1 signal peptide-containing protein [Theileria equi strain WA]